MDASRIPPSLRRKAAGRKRWLDFADPAVWAWLAVAVMLVVPAVATLA